MHRLKKLAGVVLLLTVVSMGGATAFADTIGSTEIPTRKGNQTNSPVGVLPIGSTEIPTIPEFISYLAMILPL